MTVHIIIIQVQLLLVLLNLMADLAKRQPGFSAAFNSVCFAELCFLASATFVLFAIAFCTEVETMGSGRGDCPPSHNSGILSLNGKKFVTWN